MGSQNENYFIPVKYDPKYDPRESLSKENMDKYMKELESYLTPKEKAMIETPEFKQYHENSLKG